MTECMPNLSEAAGTVITIWEDMEIFLNPEHANAAPACSDGQVGLVDPG